MTNLLGKTMADEQAMTELNCSSLESTINSAAEILGIQASELRSRLKVDGENSFTKPLVKPKSVVWFHATRIPRSTEFQDGLLPTSMMHPRLLKKLRCIAIKDNLCNGTVWDALVKKMSSPELNWKNSLLKRDDVKLDDGPHGFLIREVIINRGNIPISDYTKIPEYVKNLCSCFSDTMEQELINAYKKHSCRAIVSFRSKLHLDGVLKYALTYARTKLLGKTIHGKCNCGFSGKGEVIPKADILKIEWLDDLSAQTGILGTNN